MGGELKQLVGRWLVPLGFSMKSRAGVWYQLQHVKEFEDPGTHEGGDHVEQSSQLRVVGESGRAWVAAWAGFPSFAGLEIPSVQWFGGKYATTTALFLHGHLLQNWWYRTVSQRHHRQGVPGRT